MVSNHLPTDLHILPLKTLSIKDCQSIQLLPVNQLERCENIQSLPADLHSIPLKFMTTNGSPGIQLLPEKSLPKSLKQIDSSNCHPMLKEKLKKYKSEIMRRLEQPSLRKI